MNLSRLLLLCACASLAAAPLVAPTAASAQGSRNELFPRPAELEPDIRFWRRVYTEVGGDGGFVHDPVDLAIVYGVVRFPASASNRTRERIVENAKRHYRDILRNLARGKRSGLTGEQAQVLALFDPDVSNATLRTAASQLRFQLGQADKFRAGLIRSGAWRDSIRRTLREMGLPEELAALPHVESSFTPHAYSRVGAAGLWQFMPSTGRRYMRVDHVVDERMDPLVATVAAARLLEHNHRATGTWPLALTAYNHGAAGMRRAARKMGTTDIAVINRRYKSRTFGFASRNFYVEFLAALEIDQNPEKFFGPFSFDPPPDHETIEMPYYASASGLAAGLGLDLATLKRANPALRESVWNGSKRVPKGYELRVPRAHLAKPLETLIAAVPDTARFAAQTRDSYHQIRRGETLSAIASRYQVSVRELASLNGLRSQHQIRAGQRLRLPEPPGTRTVATVATVATVDPSVPEAARAVPLDGTYAVRRGDSLARVASRFGVSEQDLLDWNPIRNRHRIEVGQRLRVAPPLPDADLPAIAVAEASPVAEPDLVALAPVALEGGALEESALEGTELEAVVVADAQIAGADTLDAQATAVSETEESEAEESEIAADETAAGAAAEASEAAPAEPIAVAALHPDREAGFTSPAESDADLATSSETTTVASVADAAAAELARGGPADAMLLADPADYSVAADGTIEVQAAETLGHYAEWLDVRASRLRSLNRMRYGMPLAIGDRLRLDFAHVSQQEFEARRTEHHRALQGEFFERFEIDGTATHTVRRGDSIWQIAERRYGVPVWLLRQYNPDLDFADLHAGEPVTIPQLRPR